MNKEYRRGVGIFLINSENKLWVGKRIDLESNYWQMPQGGIDAFETPEIAMRRELMEELGVKTQVVELITSYNHKFSGNVYDLWFYKTRIISGQIQLNAHDKLLWIDPKDYSKYKILPGDIPVFKKILSED